MGDTVKAGVIAAHMVEESPGGGDNRLHLPAKSLYLGNRRDAAVDRHGLKRCVAGQVLKVIRDLHGQLPGGDQDQNPGFPPRLPDQLVKNGKQEGGRFAAPGHRRSHDIPALKQGRDSQPLYRGWLVKAFFRNGFQQVRVKFKRCK